MNHWSRRALSLLGVCAALLAGVGGLPLARGEPVTPAAGPEWNQEAGNAQRTGYIAAEPNEPWTLKWTWNGPDNAGGTGSHFYNAPRQAYTVMGGGAVYAPAGAEGLYALETATGAVRWNLRATTFNSTPAYDPTTGAVFAGGADGRLYKINAASGTYTSYLAGGPINRGVLVAGGYVYALTDAGYLHKVNAATMAAAWVYGAPGPSPTPVPPAGPRRVFLPFVGGGLGMQAVAGQPGTGLAYSASRDVIVYGTEDLYVQAVNNATGTLKWRVKPSPNAAGFPNQFLWYWPVVAEQHGVVFVRMRLDHNAGLWGCSTAPCAGDGRFPTTNADTRAHLASHPAQQNLFALNLDTGNVAFLPAVGYGGTEDLVNGQPYLTTGPVPVVRVWPDGKEVAYSPFRNGQTTPPTDGRWDSHLGEMVLDNTTISGLVSGDLRFIRMARYSSYGGNSYVHITDEQSPLTMAGATIFIAHAAASESAQITDRSATRGLSYGNPIAMDNRPVVIRRQTACNNFNPSTHYTTCGLALFGDGRYWDGPGFWTYWNTYDPPTVAGPAYSDGMRPRYTYVSGGFIVVEGNGGELMLFQHN